jgi:alpha-L-glutamate ligase-like protein
MKLAPILGLNARTQAFSYRYNTLRGKKNADSKIRTAAVLKATGIPYPQLFRKFRKPKEVLEFNWSTLPDRFALKPSRGLGGEGIIVVRKRLEPEVWVTTQRTRVTAQDLKLHTLDILEGAYSMGNVPDVAFIQEFVGRHKCFRRYAFRGTPDIRIIIFNKVPVMAMLRLPTKESGGRANLHQGAIGVGVDIATGITTRAILHGDQIYYKPGTKRKLRGIKIPFWITCLETAVRAQEVSGLGYCGVDVVLHPEKGPMILELNAQPGLQIQLANGTGLRKRLERVEDLAVRDAEHGVKIARALFAERYLDRASAREDIKIIGTKELVKIIATDGRKEEVWAKIDTGAWRSSLDRNLARDLGLLKKENILWSKVVRGSLGSEKRPVISLIYFLAGRRIKTIASIANREGLRRPLIIGRRDLVGFLVKPAQELK